MLGRCHVTEEIRPVVRCQGSPDGTHDVIISRRHIGHQRPQDIKGGPVAQLLLQPNIGLYLIQGNMPRPLDHHLHLLVPGPLGQLTQEEELLYLRAVSGIGQAAGAQPIPQTQGDIVLLGDFYESVEFFIEGVLTLVVDHPGGKKGPSPADDVGNPSLGLEPLQAAQGHPTMDRDEIHPILGVVLDDIKDVVGAHLDDPPLALGHLDGGLVDGNRSHREG